MLPSMPLLMTPAKELADDSSCSSDDSPTHNPIENGHAECHATRSFPTLLQDNAHEQASNGAVLSHEGDQPREKSHSPEKRTLTEPTSAQKKKKKNQHRKMLAALTPDSETSCDAYAQSFAEAYFQKVRARLDNEKWNQFFQELVSFEEQAESEKKPVDLYRRMEDILKPHSDLVDEFLGFLLPHQALEVDRIMEHFRLDKMSEFFRKLNILLMKRQVRQVYTALESLIVKPTLSLSDVKDAILPLLKSSSLLTSLFLELLPGERPPDSLMTDFEQIDVKDDSEFETVVVPDCPDPYGSENCICDCHKDQTRHCNTCGIKYLNGRVYLQHGKALRPAKVIFKDKKHLDLLKWEEEKSRNRRRLMPKTMLSPGTLENRLNADSEDDNGVKKSPRTPRLRVSRPKLSKKDLCENKEEEVLEGIFPLADSKNPGNEAVESEMKHDGMDEHDFDEIVLENECNTEEDEEEDLNKGLHSENESSIDTEDIAKELECSFEDEEVDDYENNDMDLTENLTNHKSDVSEKLANEGFNKLYSEGIEIEFSGKENHHDTDAADLCSPSFKKKSDGTDVKSVDPIIESEGVMKEEMPKETAVRSNSEIETCCALKTEAEDIMDVCDGPSADTVSSNEDPGTSERKEVETSSKEWTREEDKIILQTFQHENGLEQTFETASLQLPNRSKEEIQGRFEVLMKLLKEMISDESNSNP